MSAVNDFIDYLVAEKIAFESANTTVYMSDASFLTLGKPGLVVFPKTVPQACKVVGFAARNGIALTPRAKGSSTAGASLAPEGGVMVMTDLLGVVNRFGKRLGRAPILFYSADGEEIPAERLEDFREQEVYARVGAGLSTDELDRYLRQYNWHIAVVPSSGWSTIGGNFSTNAGGNGTPKYGTFRNVVSRLQIICSATDGGDATLRTVTDRQTIVDMGGGQGLYGIITELDVRIVPLPAPEEIFCAICHSTSAEIATLGDTIGTFMSAMQEVCAPEIAEFMMVDQGIFGDGDPLLEDSQIAQLFDYPQGQYRMIVMYMGRPDELAGLEGVANDFADIAFMRMEPAAFNKMLAVRKLATGKSPGRVALPGFEDIYVKDPKYLGRVLAGIFAITEGKLPGRPIGHQYTGGVVVHYRPQARPTKSEYDEAWQLTRELTASICTDDYQTIKRQEHGLGLEVFSAASPEERERIKHLKGDFDPANVFQPHFITDTPSINFAGELFNALSD